MGTQVYRQKNIYMKRCDKCKKLSHYTYRINLGGISYTFCSGLCAQAAQKEFDEKLQKGITPNNLDPIEEDTGGNDLEPY